MKFRFLSLIVFAVHLTGAFCQPPAEKRPNIIFIMTDDHANRAMSCYGSDLLQTPNMDRIAREGMRFDNSFVTNSICAPSRAVMLTGKYSHMNGLRDNRDEFDGSQQTFVKLLQAAGYFTAIIGKWHLKTQPTGFDYWNVLIDQGEYYNPRLIEQGDTTRVQGYTTDVITDIALKTIDNRDPNQPFCLLLHHKAPHRNWMPDAKHLSLFEDQDIPLPPTFWDDYATRSTAASTQDMR
ncbi:MAG TPA: sulfatase-like hydrolase/transferase, partial [Flavilitoribacter sp.]|nr:sulfatase-like hydrolase/transferase [Flavilitoribacter sp.]